MSSTTDGKAALQPTSVEQTEPAKALGNHSYLAKPSGACCLKGTLHEGTARGSWVTIAGVKTYKADPPADVNNGNILLYFADVRFPGV